MRGVSPTHIGRCNGCHWTAPRTPRHGHCFLIKSSRKREREAETEALLGKNVHNGRSCIYVYYTAHGVCVCVDISHVHTHTDKQTDKQTDIHTEKFRDMPAITIQCDLLL